MGGCGHSSLFVYCTKCLHLSEHAAYGRIEAARAARKFPSILDKLADGSISLTTICLLSNHLTDENHERLLEAARHKTRRDIEGLVAALHPMPAVPSTVRKLPQPKTLTLAPPEAKAEPPLPSPEAKSTASSTGATRAPLRSPAPPIVRPLAPERYRVQFSIGPETHESYAGSKISCDMPCPAATLLKSSTVV